MTAHNDSAAPDGKHEDTATREYDDCVGNGGHEWYKHGERTRVQWADWGHSAIVTSFIFTTFTVFRCAKCDARYEVIIPVVQI